MREVCNEFLRNRGRFFGCNTVLSIENRPRFVMVAYWYLLASGIFPTQQIVLSGIFIIPKLKGRVLLIDFFGPLVGVLHSPHDGVTVMSSDGRNAD